MKECPQCKRNYEDDSFTFCLDDGTLLKDRPVSFSQLPTANPPYRDEKTQAFTKENVQIGIASNLREAIEYQRKDLRKYVLVESLEINSSQLSEGKLYVDFTFHTCNYSIFYVSIPLDAGDPIKGYILFKGKMLSGAVKMFDNRMKNSPPYYKDYFTIRQWVSPEEAKDISETLKTSGNLFDFSDAIIPIKGGDKSPEAEEAQLDLTRAMMNAETENKIVQLETALSQHKDEISRWKTHADRLYGLGLLYGMAQEADDIIDLFKGSLTEEQVKHLDAQINSGLDNCLGAAARDSYYLNAPPIPKDVEGQRFWIRDHCSRLLMLIQQERQKQIPAYRPKNQD